MPDSCLRALRFTLKPVNEGQPGLDWGDSLKIRVILQQGNLMLDRNLCDQ